MSNRYVNIAACLISFFSVNTQVNAQTAFEGTWSEVLAYFSGCSATFGYDPEKAAGIPENALGKGELYWRKCAYQGLERIMLPKTAMPELYRNLIAEDKFLTEQIHKGEITRSQRKKRINAMLEDIHKRENENFNKNKKRTHEQMRRFERSRNPAARRAVRGWL